MGPKIINSTSTRIFAAFALYTLLNAISGLAFQWLRSGVADDFSIRYLYALSGPTLSLFTHMGYVLFAMQSLLLIPWLILGVLQPRTKYLSAGAFTFTWLSIGWYMHDLF